MMITNDQVRSEIARCINEVSEKTVEKAVKLANMIEQYVQSDPAFAEMFPQAVKSVEYLRSRRTVKLVDDTRKKYERAIWSNTHLVEFVPADDTSKVLYRAFSNTLKGAVEEFKKNNPGYDRENVQYRYADSRYATPVYGRYGL